MNTATLLNVESVAQELNVDPIAIKRVIARGHLKASEVGGGKFVIDPDDLRSYVAKGSPDLKFPDLHNNWFQNGDILTASSGFLQGILDRIGHGIEAGIYPEPEKSGETIPVRYAGDIRNFCEQSPDRIVRMPGATNGPLPSRKIAMAVDRIQKIARNSGSGLHGLYATPDRYRELTEKAVDTFLASSVSMNKSFPGKDAWKTISGTYRLNHAEMGFTNRQQLIDQAF